MTTQTTIGSLWLIGTLLVFVASFFVKKIPDSVRWVLVVLAVAAFFYCLFAAGYWTIGAM